MSIQEPFCSSSPLLRRFSCVFCECLAGYGLKWCTIILMFRTIPMGDAKEGLVFCKVIKYQKDVQVFIAERAFLNELSYLTANATAILLGSPKSYISQVTSARARTNLSFPKHCLENIKLLQPIKAWAFLVKKKLYFPTRV